MSWATEEFRTLHLGDKRLDRRTVLLAEQLAEAPTESIPNACGKWADTQAAYRLLSHENLTWEQVLTPHFERVTERMRPHPVVLCLADTTELDFKGKTIQGLGPLSYEAQRGMYLHPTYAVTPEREPLGVCDAWMWARKLKGKDGKRPETIKESVRWVEGFERVCEQSTLVPDTRLVYVADRESDMVDLFSLGRERQWPADVLVRSRHNRALPDGTKLWKSVGEQPALGEVSFVMEARHGVKKRTVRQRLYIQRVSIKDGEKATVEMTCIIAREVGAPKGIKPVEWRLLTNRLAETLEEVVGLIDWYRARWEIEMLFNILKTGCRVESLQLASVQKIETLLALYLVISWRINRLMRLGRTCPDLPAELVFDRDEWEAAYILNKKPVPSQMPRLNDVVRLIAGCGGFLMRKGDGEPGVKTLWLGLRKVQAFVQGRRYEREMAGSP